jgi:hypothetical protein
MLDNLSENKRVLAITAIGLLIVIIAIIVIRPVIIGYTTYFNQKESGISMNDYQGRLNSIQIELSKAKTNLSACIDFSDKVFVQLDSRMSEYSGCQDELHAALANLSISKARFENEIESARRSVEVQDREAEKILDEKEDELRELESKYSLLAKSSANNICCKAKVDNTNINYYTIENNKLVCLESGEKKLDC